MTLEIHLLVTPEKDAIRTWFRENGKQWFNGLSQAEQEGFIRFEGNAQGFRLLTRLLNPQNRGGLQLTYAMLGAFTKYPHPSIDSFGSTTSGVSAKKFGFAQQDASVFEEVANRLALHKRDGSGGWCCHPLAFLTEAADDICYRIVDFEDGIRLGHVDFSIAEPLLKKLAFGDKPDSDSYARIDTWKEKTEYLRAKAINELIYAVTEVFLQRETELLAGSLDAPLVDQLPQKQVLDDIKRLSREKIYCVRKVLEIEAAGFEVLGGLLERTVSALLREKPTAADRKLLELIPNQYCRGETTYEKLLSATDFVSGMTDSYALTLYRRVRGIELPRA